MEIETLNNTYKVINFKRSDNLYNIYVQKTSKNSGAYIGEATYLIGSKDKVVLGAEDVIKLKYEIY
jgi:hypothetical protein